MQEPYLGTRQRTKKGALGGYAWQSFAQCSARRSAIGSGLLALGVPAAAYVGLFGINSADWMLVDLALHAYSMVAVPLYDTLGAEVVSYICGHAELAAVACDAAVLPTLLASLADCASVKLVVRPLLTCEQIACNCALGMLVASLDDCASVKLVVRSPLLCLQRKLVLCRHVEAALRPPLCSLTRDAIACHERWTMRLVS